jgi:hypothetical protein
LNLQINEDIRAKVLSLTIKIGVLTAVISQIMMQLGGGPRDELMDHSDQFHFQGNGAIFDGLPPFISSAGVFPPESIVFGIGFSITGFLLIWLSYQLKLETSKQFKNSTISNVHTLSNDFGLLAGITAGTSLIVLSWTPMNTKLVAHIILAILVFCSAIIWALLVTTARSKLDEKIIWRGKKITHWRWILIAVTFFSVQLTILFAFTGNFYISALFEWILLSGLIFSLATYYPIFSNSEDEEE